MDDYISTIISCDEVRSHVMRDDREQLNNEQYNREMRYRREQHINEREQYEIYIYSFVILLLP